MNDDRPAPAGKRVGRNFLRPRFTVATLLLAMILVGTLGAGLYYGAMAIRAGMDYQSVLVILTLCAPPLLLIAAVAARELLTWINRPHDDDEA